MDGVLIAILSISAAFLTGAIIVGCVKCARER